MCPPEPLQLRCVSTRGASDGMAVTSGLACRPLGLKLERPQDPLEDLLRQVAGRNPRVPDSGESAFLTSSWVMCWEDH